MILGYVKAFLIGAVLCMIGQVLIDKTKLTPARILTLYVVAGVVLGAVGIYGPFAKWAGADRFRQSAGERRTRCRGRKGHTRRVYRRLHGWCRRHLRGHFLWPARGDVF